MGLRNVITLSGYQINLKVRWNDIDPYLVFGFADKTELLKILIWSQFIWKFSMRRSMNEIVHINKGVIMNEKILWISNKYIKKHKGIR